MPEYPTRTITYACDLYHGPSQPSPQAIQKLHNALFESGVPAYSSFAVTPLGPVLTNPGTTPGFVSQVAFLGDRIQFREELGGLTCEGFGQRVRTIVERGSELRGVRGFRGQQITIRSLVNPRHHADSRAFLRRAVFGFGSEVETFGREPGVYGLRLAFPPTEDEPTSHALRIESYVQDPRSLFLEVQSSFGPFSLPEGLETLERNVSEAYGFLVERALAFVSGFDQPVGD